MTSQQDTELQKILLKLNGEMAVALGTNKAGAKGEAQIRAEEAMKEAIQALTSWKDKEVRSAVYGFHEFIIGENIIQKEQDQAFNYARLHRALDGYIESLQSQGGK